MAMALYEPVSVVMPLRLCSTPESMDEKSSESDMSRSNSPRNSQESSSGEDSNQSERGRNRESPAPDTVPSTTPPTANDLGSHPRAPSISPPNQKTLSSSENGSNMKESRGTSQSNRPPTGPKPPISHQTPLYSSSSSNPLSTALTSSTTATCLAGSISSMTLPPASISTSRLSSRGSNNSSPCQPSPVSSATTGLGHSLHPSMLLSQNETATATTTKGATETNNNMLTLGSYVQFMTLQQQGQMGYPALLQSACLPPSVANPPTTLPPQYDTNFSQSYSPSLSSSLQSFGCAAAGLIPPQLNQGLIAVDMPMATAASSAVPHSKINIGGLDHHKFMVSGPIPGTLPNHEVARAIGGMGLPLVVTGRNEGGGGGGPIESGGESGGYKRARKRTYSQTNSDLQDAGDLHGYNGSMRRSVFPSEDHCSLGDSSSGGGSGLSSSGSGPSGAGGGGGGGPPQQLKWQAHQVDTWHDLCDGVLQDIPQIGFTVETDKGFVFSVADDAFVCQKKNHFQVTVSVLFHRAPKFIKIKGGSIQPVDKFMLFLHGVKLESVGNTIKLEQSMTDRRRSDFIPVEVPVPANAKEPAKHTVCRLHFGETTANNMRKRGKPNPDQKFFSLVVGLNAVCELGSFPVVAHVSERIIVRASNPGNFDNDCDYLWLKSNTPDSIYHHGRVGINTDKPEEALSVNGNIRVTGCIEHPSDMRIKTDILPVDSSRQLERLCRMRLYQYRYKDGVMRGANSSNEDRQQVGVLAQELREILPEAVHETNTDVPLSDGSKVSKLLVIDKDRVLMETVGAVQGLKQFTDDVNQRLDIIEKGLSSMPLQTALYSSRDTQWGSAFGVALAFLLGCLMMFILMSLMFCT